MKNLELLLLVICVGSTYGKNLPFDLGSTATSVAHFQCVRQQYEQIGLFTTTSQTGLADVCRQCYSNAKSAGLRVSITYTPCRITNAQQQASDIIKKLGTEVERVWIYLFDFFTADNCKWAKFPVVDNCIFLQNIVSAFKNNGLRVGIATFKSGWTQLFGSL